MFEINDTAGLELALTKMSEEQRDHLRIVISEIIQCYIDDDLHGMVLIGKEPYVPFKIMAINTNEINAVHLLDAAAAYIDNAVMEDAPPKDKFN
jgi:hypothetical protein